MIYRVPDFDPEAPAVIVDVGNTTTAVATWHEDQIKSPLSVPTSDDSALCGAFTAHLDGMPKREPAAVVVGSVVPTALERIRAYVGETLDREALVVGDTIALPIDVGVTDAKAIGTDRVCAAAAAYDTLQSACIVIDFGSAVTVDLVNDEGTLLGGAILPGIRMQLRALHEYTAALPEVQPASPEHTYGRDTTEAMQVGVCRGIAGAARGLIEGYAKWLNRWPQVVATGGDLTFVAPLCDFLDTQVQHLTLRGIGLAYSKHLEALGK